MVMDQRIGSKDLSTDFKNKTCDFSKAGHTPTYIAHFYILSRNTEKTEIRCIKLQMSKIVKKKAGRKHKLAPRCLHRLLN